jgi:methyltransferase (TIGR00027 family)
MSKPGTITHVSDTARWVACYRALETERPDAIFNDPWARRLAGDRGFEILDNLPDGRKLAWPMVTRTAVMDEIILRSIKADAVDTVLNLAAGLDARPWRLSLPPALRWIDVDLPDMLDYKQSVLASERPICQYEPLGVDLADGYARRELFRTVGRSAKRVLIITEGLLIYLEPGQVANLARDLHAVPTMRLWLTDLASPALLARLEKNWAPALRAGNAPLLFGPAEGSGFFAPLGWHEVEYRSTFAEGLRLRRSFRFARIVSFMGLFAPRAKREEFKRFSGIVLFGRQA